MKNEKKQIVTVVECDNYKEIPVTIAEMTASLADNEILVAVKATMAMRKDGTKFYAVETTTILGNTADVFPHTEE